MYFNLASVVSAVILALPLAASAAPASEFDLEARGRKTHKVTVGAGGKLRYHPEYVHAKVGDHIRFEFYPKNHTVTESSFDAPCAKSGDVHAFGSGFIPVPDNQTSHFPTRVYKVTDKQPHWFYCAQVGHCSAGMVFAVNPPKKGNNFHQFQQKAAHSGN